MYNYCCCCLLLLILFFLMNKTNHNCEHFGFDQKKQVLNKIVNKKNE